MLHKFSWTIAIFLLFRGTDAGVYMGNERFYWPKGVICYEFSSAYTEEQRNNVAKHLTHFSSTPILPITKDECEARPDAASICNACQNVVWITTGYRPQSGVGYRPWGNTEMWLKGDGWDRTDDAPLVLHEFGHALGLHHERLNKDVGYITVPDWVDSTAINDLKLERGKLEGVKYTPFDHMSVMFYGPRAGYCKPKEMYKDLTFCDVVLESNPDGCVVPTRDHCLWVHGQTLSAGDIHALRLMYGDGVPKDERPQDDEDDVSTPPQPDEPEEEPKPNVPTVPTNPDMDPCACSTAQVSHCWNYNGCELDNTNGRYWCLVHDPIACRRRIGRRLIRELGGRCNYIYKTSCDAPPPSPFVRRRQGRRGTLGGRPGSRWFE